MALYYTIEVISYYIFVSFKASLINRGKVSMNLYGHDEAWLVFSIH